MLARIERSFTLISADALFNEAAELCKQARCGQLLSWTRLNAGKNNQTYQLNLIDGSKLIFKKYHRHKNDLRDRLGAEWKFLDYVWQAGIRHIPEPIIKDESKGAALYQYIEGRKLNSAEINETLITEAADFVVAINNSVKIKTIFEPASEACFSMGQHLDAIQKRIIRLEKLDSDAPYKIAAEKLISTELVPAWETIKNRILSDEKCSIHKTIDPVFLSPSDFGFHNILYDEVAGLKFIDFEYAGLDDLAKLTNDFMSCPEIPVSEKFRSIWVERIARKLNVDSEFFDRVQLLDCAYQVKWICIILNDFLFVGSQRREFAGQVSRAERCEKQLIKARHKMNDILNII